MNKMFEDFFSNQWNLYGLQIACGLLMVIVLHNYLSYVGMCAMGLCVYLIAICQRILGIRFGMIFAQLEKEKIDAIVSKVKKIQKKRKLKRNKK